MKIKKPSMIFGYKRGLSLFFVALLLLVGLQVVAPGTLKNSRVEAATIAENKANARATDTHITTNCTLAIDYSYNDYGPFYVACVARFKAFYLGDGSAAPNCPADDGSANYQYCQEEAPKNGYQQAAKDFPDIDKLCGVFISNAKGGSWPDFSNLSGSDKQKAIDACNAGVGAGFTYAPGDYPANEPCKAKYQGRNTLLQACYAGESLMDAHLFTISEVKAIARSGNLTKTDNGSSGGGGGAGAGAGGQGADTPQCETSGFALSWAFCAIINGLAGAMNDLYNDFIQPFLETKPINVTNPQGDKTHVYEIWSNFRVYGDIFLVIALLVIVFGESVGGGMIDSYTAKKILPRLLVAAVLINLSIYIVAFAVDITNIVGDGIGQLIEQPFRNAGAFQLKVGGGTASFGLGIITAGGIWAVAGAGVLLEFLLVFFLIPAFLALLGVLVVIIIRTGLIVFLVLISPVAFALYCLPNTEQYFRKWWDLLLRTLLIYPIIAIIFAMANVLSITINLTASGALQKPIADLISVIALFVPLFLIPYSFRIAGGALGQIHEVASNLAKRAHGGIIGSEQNPASWRNTSRAKVNQRYAEKGMTPRAMAQNFVPAENVLTKGGRQRWRENREARRAATRARLGGQFAESDEVFQNNKGNDNYLLALANPGMAQEKLAAATDPTEQAKWRGAIASARITHSSPAVRLQALRSLAATGFQFDTGQQGYDQLASTVADITGARLETDPKTGHAMGASGPRAQTYADEMDFAQYSLRSGGRFDLGGINNGTGYNYEMGIDKSSGYTGGQGKPGTYVAGAEHFLGADISKSSRDNDNSRTLAEALHKNLSSGQVSIDKVGDWHSKLLDAQHSATGANRNEIDKQVEAIQSVASSYSSAAVPDTPALNAEARTRFTDQIKRNQQSRRSQIDPNLIDKEE